MIDDDEFSGNDDPSIGEGDGDRLNDGSARTRFGADQESNGSGRPKGARDRNAAVRRIANKRMYVNDNGKRKRLSYLEILVRSIRNWAIKGEHASLAAADHLRQIYLGDQSDMPTGLLIVPESCETAEDWEARNQPGAAAARLDEFKRNSWGIYDELLVDTSCLQLGGYESGLTPPPDAKGP